MISNVNLSPTQPFNIKILFKCDSSSWTVTRASTLEKGVSPICSGPNLELLSSDNQALPPFVKIMQSFFLM